MTVRIETETRDKGIISTVEKMSGVDLSTCYQCKKCNSGCPVTRLVQSSPSEIVRRLQLGAGNELLESDLIWLCLSCETCHARCPMEINIASVIDALRSLSLERKASKPKGNIPLFNRLFLGTVKAFGRTYDFPMIAFYKLGTFNLIQDMDKVPAMLKKRKIALLPPSGANKHTITRIFSKMQQNKGTVK